VTGSERQTTLDGRWALVTGAAKRIGAVIARTLHGAGANVAIHYHRSAADAEQLAATLNSARPSSAFATHAVVLDFAALERLA
jgi:pteridine reductase